MKTLIIIILFSINLYGQREYFNWYFGDSCGITFNTVNLEPISLIDSKNSTRYFDYPISISNKYGNLILSTSNTNIKDDNHNIIYNFEFDLLSRFREDKGVQFCIKKPNSDSVYFIFMQSWLNDSFKYKPINDSTEGLFIWTYNANKKILEKKNIFIEDSLFSNFDITSHHNGEDYWLITSHYKYSEIYIYQITENGISKKPINIEKIEFADSLVPYDISISPNSKKVAISYSNYHNYEGFTFLADFDNYNGKLSNKAFIKTKSESGENLAALSCEFSPDSKNVFFTYFVNDKIGSRSYNKLYKFNLHSNNNQESLYSTKEFILDYKNYNHLDLELGPNGKLYMQGSGFEINHLLYISNPNSSNIEYDTLQLAKGTTRNRFPKNLKSSYSFINIEHFQNICENEKLKLQAKPLYYINSHSFTWEGPNNYFSDEESPIIDNISKIHEGIYKVKIYNESDTLIDSTNITVNEINDFMIKKSKNYLCSNDSLILFTQEDFEILWDNNISSKSYTIYQSGTFTAEYNNSNNCSVFKTIEISEFDILPELTATKNNFCQGDSATLSLDKEYEVILWNTGDITKDIIVKDGGVYSATVTDGECTNDTSIEIKVNPLPEINVLAPNGTILCDGGSIEIEVIVGNGIGLLWNDGSRIKKRTFNETGTYTVTAKDINTGCEVTKEIVISDIGNTIAEIIGNNEFCSNESTTLTITPQGQSYLWNTGEISQSIVVNLGGIYSATITTEAGCELSDDIEVIEYPNPEFEIKGEKIICNNSTELYVEEGFESYLWSTGATENFIIVYEPGNYSVTITDINGCKAENGVEVIELSPELNLSTNYIDFGEILFGQIRVHTITADKAIIKTQDTKYYDATINNQQITLTFNPDDIGEFLDTLIVESLGYCKAIDTIYIKGICKAEILAKVSDSEGYPNDDVVNKVSLELQQQIPLPKDFNYEIKLNINQDAIQIIDNTTFSYLNKKLEIDINDFIVKNNYNTNIKDINSKIMLARNHDNPIEIVNFITDNQYLIPLRQDGMIKIYEVCIDESRLIKHYNPAEILKLNKTILTLNTKEEGKYSIEITDINGKSIYKKVENGLGLINFNYQLSNGSYLIKINEPGKTQTLKVIFME